jgi:hypothetical protein
MRRLTLILSDLYLPEEAGRDTSPPPTHDLPNLEWLLRFADSPEKIGDWRTWLLDETVPALRNIPIASICAFERIDGRELDSTWLATPVALEARLDHVRLLDRGLLHLYPAERDVMREEFARALGPQYLLHDGGDRGFFLSGLPTASFETVDPARLLGSEIGPAMPGREAGDLRRLWAEIEMWLHGAAFNEARERARKRRVSALWLWGAASGSRPSGRIEPWHTDAKFYGGDPFITQLGRHGGGLARGVPTQLAQLNSDALRVVVEFAALTGEPHESLQALDANWFAPARAALESGSLAAVDLVANDRCFRIRARQQWKFWRRRQHWLASLGS